MKDRWQFGESCAIRGIVNNQVWLAQAVIVVKDELNETILLLTPGAQCAIPEGLVSWRMHHEFSHGSRWQESKSENFTLREYIWHTNRLLIFLEPEKYFACCIFWNHTSNQFGCYYINFQLPIHRSRCGFDTLDLDLDIVIDAQYNWKWKDLEEYNAGIKEGGILAEWVEGIESSKNDVFDRIDKRSYPLDGSWLEWQPPKDWIPPKLPKEWHIV